VLSQELVDVTAGAAAGAASAPATHAVVKSKKAAFTNQHLHIETEEEQGRQRPTSSVGIVSLGWGLLLIIMSLYGGVDS